MHNTKIPRIGVEGGPTLNAFQSYVKTLKEIDAGYIDEIKCYNLL